jgi:acetyl esterase/lipase
MNRAYLESGQQDSRLEPAFAMFRLVNSRRFLVLFVLSLTIPVSSALAQQHRTAEQRMEAGHLKAVHEARLQFARERKTLPNFGPFEDYRAVIHVHAEDSDHTKGTRAEVLAAAKKTGVRIVMWTDHGGPKPDTWRGLRDGVLFIAGEENGGAGLLCFPISTPADGDELRFISHIEERYDASPDGFAGMEISNRHSDAVLDETTLQFLHRTASDPEAWQKLVKNFELYPDEIFAAGADYREKIFEKWDRETAKRPFTGIAANDAHQNQIIQGVTFDLYEVSFRNLTTHILARDLTERDVRDALRDGHAYVSHDWLCDPTGFAFGAVNNLGVFPMGDPAIIMKNTRLVALTPISARLTLFHNGKIVQETTGTNLTFTAKDPGAYRVEAWLEVAGEGRPWIYSNPVYLRAPDLADLLRLPSMEISANVELKKDIAYTDTGLPKHHLDIYQPKDSNAAPVFVFLHGGSWRSGDRSQYVPVGNRFAKAGILTVIPSYRLAPKNPHPAQIEDAAAAFAWTVRNIANYGGDTNRIYLGGHSAGGHLAALLALNPAFLKKHEISPQSIRGAITLSGVYDLLTGDSQESVFGRDPGARKDASPFYHITSRAPPFLVTYCQWDYPTLPDQAKRFHSALRESGISSELIFVPRESHISEMINVPNNGDPTAEAVIKFVKTAELHLSQ